MLVSSRLVSSRLVSSRLVSSRLVSSRLNSPFAPSVLAGVICAALSLASPQGYADESVWVEMLAEAVADSRVQARGVSKPVLTEQLEKYRLFSLDEQRLEGQLSVVTAARSAAPDTASGMEISLPLPDGSFVKVEVVGTNMFPDDAEAQAEFKTWEVRSLDGKVLGGVLDFSDSGGFHAMLELRNGDTVFIDPQATRSGRTYLSFGKRANQAAFQQEWQCGTPSSELSLSSSKRFARAVITSTPGRQIRHYKLAVAATHGYTTLAGSKTNALTRIRTVINRVNFVMRRDLSVQLDLVSNTNSTFLAAETIYPFKGLSDSLGIARAGTAAFKTAGITAYDIGHVFGTEGSGGVIPRTGTVCAADKGQGYSQLGILTTEAFAINMVAHEMGHQLGAEHSYNTPNGFCGTQRQAGYAVEPGVGATIMSYSDSACDGSIRPPTFNAPTGVNTSDALYHSTSIARIQQVVHASGGGGTACGINETITNTRPTPVAGKSYTIPAGTPFVLKSANWTDPDGNSINYSWEQVNTSSMGVPIGTDDGVGALIRVAKAVDVNGNISYKPERTVPAMELLLSTSPVANAPELMGEKIPRASNVGAFRQYGSRRLTFRLVGRDNRGGVSTSDTNLTVVRSTAGVPFAITAPTITNLSPGQVLDVKWNIAGTNQTQYNCPKLDIEVTNNGGLSFGRLATNVPNTPTPATGTVGSYPVRLPTSLVASRPSHIRIRCMGDSNIFFAVSKQNPYIFAR